MEKADLGGLNCAAYSNIENVLFSQDSPRDRRLGSLGT